MFHKVVNPNGCLGVNLGNSTNMNWRNSRLYQTYLNWKITQSNKITINTRIYESQNIIKQDGKITMN